MALKVRKHAAPMGLFGGASPMVAMALGLVLLAGGLLGAFSYDRSTAGRILPGVTVAGVDVGEMSPSEAIPAVRETVDALLGYELTVRAGQETWHVTPAEVGAAVDVEGLVDGAVALNEGFSWPERVFRRAFDRPIARSLVPRIEVEANPVLSFLRGVARQVEVSPTDARVEVVNGEVSLRPPRAGWALRAGEARRLLARALRASDSQVDLPLKRLEPKVSKEELGYTIVVRLSDLKLYLYDGLKLDRTYPVAAGSPDTPRRRAIGPSSTSG